MGRSEDDRTRSERPSSRDRKDPEPGDSTSAFDPPRWRFDERAEIGRGGMGRVTEAFDLALGRDVAVKHMLSPEGVERFEREARITARLEHPSIVPLYDAGRNPDGTPFYVMRKVDGRPLDQLVDSAVTLSDRLALVPNVLAACDAAGFAHARRIVHRDIKPTNILVGAFGESLLIDWGLAREIGAAADTGGIPESDIGNLTRVGTVAGTPGFMAPEQARGEDADARADVFALGATLYFVLARETPYANSGSGTEMIAMIAADRTPDWSRLPDELPADLRAIVVKAMAPRTADRYPDGASLAADLRRYITGKLVGAHRYGALEQLRRWIRRHRAAVIVASASMVVLAIVATLAVKRVIAERDDATAARALAEQRQREAQDIGDGELVAHAAALADSDPIAAIGGLRNLRAGSSQWRTAAAVLEGMRLHGIPFGYRSTSRIHRVATAPGAHRAFSLDMTGHLVLYDLEARTRTPIRGDIVHPIHIDWLDDDRIAAIQPDQVIVSDLHGKTVERIASPDAKITTGWIAEDGRLWVLAGTKLYERDAGAWRPIVDDVDAIEPDPKLERALVRHADNTLVLWTRDGSIPNVPLSSARISPLTATYGSDWVVFRRDDTLEQWRRKDGTYVLEHSWPTRSLLQISTIGDVPVAMMEGRFTYLTRSGGTWTTPTTPLFVVPNDHGAIVVQNDGALDLYDGEGKVTLGRGTAAYHTLDWSRDGRFVVAATDDHHVVIWDLATMRPRVHHFDTTQRLLAVDATSLYLYDNENTITQFNRETRAVVDLGMNIMLRGIDVSADSRWVQLIGVQGVDLFDTIRNKVRHFPGPPAMSTTLTGVLVAETETVMRYDAATPDGVAIATLPFKPAILLQADGELVGIDTSMVRYHLATKTYEIIPDTASISTATLASDTGEIVVIADGEIRRLVGDKFVPIDTPKPCDSVFWANHAIVVRCANALLQLEGNSFRALASDVRDWRAHDDLVVYQNAQHEVSVIDRRTNTHVPVGVVASADVGVFVYGTHFFVQPSAAIGASPVFEYTFDPAATEDEFRKRLAASTNAIDLRGAVAWPEN